MKHALAALLLTASAALGQPTLLNSDGTGMNNPTFRNAVLPVQTSQGGKYLKTDGTSATWESVTGATVDNSAVNAAIATAPATTRSSLGLGTAATADTSTTGGANKVPLLDGNGTLRLGPVNSTDNPPTQSFIIPAFQRTLYESKLGTTGAMTYLIANHSSTLGNDIGFGAGVFPELFNGSPRHCFYWDEGFQFGNADNNRGYGRYIYFRALGNASSPDPVRQSVPTFWNGSNWNGGTAVASNMGLQWVPGTTTTSGEFVFAITPTTSAGGTVNALTNGVLSSVAGAVLPFSVTQLGPKVGSGKVLTFGDATTMSTAFTETDALALMQARAGNAILVAGTKAVADTSVTTFTNVQLTRKVAGGTIGDLTYSLSDGVGFTINSASGTDTSVVSYLLSESLVSETSPAISGNHWVGETLTATTGGGGGGWQWYANGVAISGKTSATYVIEHNYIGQTLTVREGGTVSNSITAWHPDDESGYLADYRADVGLYQTVGGAASVHGDPVGQWRDQSGNGHHVSQSTSGHRGLLDTTTTAGYPYVNFDGVDDWLTKSVTLSRPQTVFIVGLTDTSIPNRRMFATASSGSRMLIYPQTTTIANITASVTYALATKNIITAKTTATANTIRLDGGAENSVTETTGNGDAISIGGSAATNSFDGRINAVLFYNADLDANAQTRVRQYLKAKWDTL